jgi:putative restriction endonuclease
LFDKSYALVVIQLWLGQYQADRELTEQEIDAITEAEAECSAPEGKAKLATHLKRERRPELVQLAKRLFRANHDNRLFCEVCRFDFGPIYGEPDFIEAHHRIPLRDCQPGHRTKISDLAMVCANCHRMLHRGNPWPTVEELKQRINERAAAHF